RFALADQIEHHHRVREERDHRREDAVRDVTRDVGAAQAEERGREETGDADEDRGEQRLSQGAAIVPSAFITTWLPRIIEGLPPPPPDIAMGRGRHARALTRSGLSTFGVDVRFDAVRDAVRAASSVGLPIRAWCADLTQVPLPASYFALVVVTRYLQRDLLPSI